MDERFPGSPGPDAPPPYLGGAAPGAGQMSERMQSLLSRAVEDQMAEQRQLQLLVNDIRGALAQLQEEVRQNAGAQALEVVRGEVGGLGGEVRSSTAVIGERLEAVVRAVTASVQAVQSVSGQLERIHEQLAHQQQVIAALPATMQRALAEATSDTAVRDEMVALRAEIAQMRAATGELVRGEVGSLSQGVQAQVSELRSLVEREVGGARDAARSGSEDLARQLTAHVDTAVIALVEALLRRRGPSGAAAAPAAATAAEPVASLTGASPETAPQPGGEPAFSGVTSAAAPRLAPSRPKAGGDAPRADEVSGDDLAHEPTSGAAEEPPQDPAQEPPPLVDGDAEEAQAFADEVFDDVASGLADRHEDVPPSAAEPTTAEAVDALTAVAATTADVPADGDPAAGPAGAGDDEDADAPRQQPAVDPDAGSAQPVADARSGGDAASADLAGEEGIDGTTADADAVDTGADGIADDDEVEADSEDDDDADEDDRSADDDDDAEARLRWSAADDRPQAAFTMGRGWDTARERGRPSAEEPPGDDADARPERRRPWWRPGG